MRVALAGVGHWHAPLHLDAVRHAGAAISGVWDHDATIADSFAATEHLSAQSLPDLLASRPDLVVVMGHPHHAPETARVVLAAGLPMMLEKPAAPDTARLAAIAPAAGHFVAVPLANRCAPLWQELARLRAEDRLGRVVHAHFRLINGPPARYRIDGVPWLLDPAIAGGGALRNLGLHLADAALMLCGAEAPHLLSASVGNRAHGEAVDDYALATLRAPDGAIITIETGYTFASMAPGGDFEWRVAATGATLIDRGEACVVTTLDDPRHRTLAPLAAGARYRAFMADTLTRLREGRPPLVSFDDYLRAMRLVDDIYMEAAK